MTEAMEFLKSKGLFLERSQFTGGWTIRYTALVDRSEMDAELQAFRLRGDEFLPKFGFAILDDVGVEACRKYAPLLEVGAGSGYWSYELQKAGVDVVATDPTPGAGYGAIKNWPQWCQIEPCDGLTAVKRYPNRNLLIVWPSLHEPWAREAIETFHGTVLYVGEGDGGCTADDSFHQTLDRDFENIDNVTIPQFFGIHDYLQVWKRRTNDQK